MITRCAATSDPVATRPPRPLRGGRCGIRGRRSPRLQLELLLADAPPPAGAPQHRPGVIGRSYPAEVGLVGDARAGLAALLEELGAGEPAIDHDWGAPRAARARRELRDSFRPEVREYAAMHAARARLPRESIVTHDAAGFNFWSAYSWPAYRPPAVSGRGIRRRLGSRCRPRSARRWRRAGTCGSWRRAVTVDSCSPRPARDRGHGRAAGHHAHP